MVLGNLLKLCFRFVVSKLGLASPRAVELDPEPNTPGSPSGHSETPVTDPDPAPLPWWEVETPATPGSSIYVLGRPLQDDSNRRILWAYLRGRQAAAIKRGELGCFSGPRSDLRNRCYVVLWTVSTPDPFVTWDYSLYIQTVQGTRPTIEVNSISHGFPSLAEATAFCLGAGLRSCAEIR